MRVILKRGGKPDLRYGDESVGRARTRAESLGWLHNVVPQESNGVIVVDASEYYTDKKEASNG